MRNGKNISVLLCFLLLFMIIIPPKNSQAFAPAAAIPLSAIPGSVKAFAGAMALGGAILAGIATGDALDSIDFDLVERAQEIWDGFSTVLKNAWEDVFDSLWGSSTDSVPVVESLRSAINVDLPIAYLKGNSGLSMGEAVRKPYITDAKNAVRFEYEDGEYLFLIIDGSSYGLYRALDIWYRIRGGYGEYGVVYRVQGTSDWLPVWTVGRIDYINGENWNDIRDNVLVNARVALGFANVHGSGLSIGIVSRSVLEQFNEMRQDIYSSSFPLVTANEIYYPLHEIFPYAEELGLDYPLEWNAELEAFVLPSNPSIPYNGNIGWYVPVPMSYVDSNENVRIGFPAVDGTIRDAYTGENVGTWEGVPSIPVPGEGEVPAGFFDGVLQGIGNITSLLSSLVGVFTDGLVGDISSIQWQKLMDVGYNMTNKFPFSIPWDVGRAFDAVFGGISGGGPPVWEFQINWLGRQYVFSISIPEYFLDWFAFVRTFILVVFDIGIILSVRQWLGGAS